MTNRHRAWMPYLLALTLAAMPQCLRADEPVVAKKATALAVASSKARVAVKKEEKPKPERFDLARDLGGKLVRAEAGKFVPQSSRAARARKTDYYLVYFGAHWCPASKKLTPKLAEFYREQRAKHRNFEVIFVSADKDEKAMLQFMEGYKMPWAAVKFSERKKIASISELAGRGHPCLALVDADGNLVAHSYGKDRKGNYVEPQKTLEVLKQRLEGEGSKPLAVPVPVSRVRVRSAR